jgi:hypothetical protein
MNNRYQARWTALFVLGASAALWAHQPSPVEVNVESIIARRGDSFLRLTNNTREPQTITFSPGPAGTANFRALRPIVLSPNAALEANLGQLQLEDGVQILHVISTVELRGGGTVPGPELHEILEVDRTGISKTTYERAFLSNRAAITGPSVPLRVDIGGGYFDAQPIARLAFPAAALSEDTPIERVDEVSPFELSNMRLRELPEDGEAEGDGIFPRRASLGQFQSARGNDAAPQREIAPFGTIKGKFSVKLPGKNNGDPAFFQAAWGWKVRVWQWFGGQWFQLASANVGSDGKWSADFVLPPFPNQKVRVEYQPANRFLQVQDAGENIYTWFDEWAVTGALTDVGFRSADLTKTGDAPGIDRIYQAGMALWRKFKKYGMNALRDVPVEITFPNTLATGKCQIQQGGMTVAWSCSQFADGKIWMIAPGATGTVQHELGHSIHNYYWNGNMPSGSGIQHNQENCYNPGLGLSEGFATFLAYWVQFEPDAVNPVEARYNFNIETPGSGFCLGSSNEVRVASTFWDVYDKSQDGTSPIKDTWRFAKPYAPVSTFLKNPGHNAMYEYMGVYTDILGSNMAVPIASLFVLNTTQLP